MCGVKFLDKERPVDIIEQNEARGHCPGGAAMSEAVDVEKQKKTNQTLAIGVGVLGVGAFGAFYVLFFLVAV